MGACRFRIHNDAVRVALQEDAMKIAGTEEVKDNGTFMETEELVRNAGSDAALKSMYGAMIINKTVEKQDEMANALRTEVNHSLGKALRVDGEA